MGQIVPFPSRLGVSPDLEAGLRNLSARDAAYGRMLDAAKARDDAAYDRARAEFWQLGGAA